MKGADVPSLSASGMAPGDLVAFRYEAGWVQIPVQVDERDAVEFAQIYGDPAVNPTAKDFGTDYYDEFYTDPDTFTGPDSDVSLQVWQNPGHGRLVGHDPGVHTPLRGAHPE